MVNVVEGSAWVVRQRELFAICHLETPSARFEDDTPEEREHQCPVVGLTRPRGTIGDGDTNDEDLYLLHHP